VICKVSSLASGHVVIVLVVVIVEMLRVDAFVGEAGVLVDADGGQIVGLAVRQLLHQGDLAEIGQFVE